MPEKFEIAALFLRLGHPSKLIHYENGAFRERSSNRRIRKRHFLRISVDGKHFENGACAFPAQVFLNHRARMT